jgi:nucleoside-diphosphate-sugar epimerase
MAVLLTGGYGHIASWTALLLAREGRRVILYDARDDAPDHLAEVASQITFIKGDILDLPALADAFKRHDGDIDGIIHTVGVMAEMVLLNPHHHVTLNVMGLVNVLELARIFDVRKVLYTSSGAVYGALAGLATEARARNPTDLYAATKVAAEHIGMQYEQTFGIDFRIARLYFVYGPGRYPSRFISLYRVAFGALEGLPDLRMDKGADQKLDFTYVEDAARGLVLLFNAANPRHKIYNIASGKAHSVGEVVAMSERHTYFPARVQIGPGHLMRRCEALDISRAANELGYQPRVVLEEGIKRYAGWLRQQLSS